MKKRMGIVVMMAMVALGVANAQSVVMKGGVVIGKNDKGDKGDKGDTGATGGIGTASSNSGMDQACTTEPANPASGHIAEWCDPTTRVKGIKDSTGANVAPTGRPIDQRGINFKTNCPGVVGDGVTDDLAAFNACKVLYAGRDFYFPATNILRTINSPHYYFSAPITLDTISISGDGSCWFGNCGTVLAFPRGSDGIIATGGTGNIRDIGLTGTDPLPSNNGSESELGKLIVPGRSATGGIAMSEYDQTLSQGVALDVSRTSGVSTFVFHNIGAPRRLNGIVTISMAAPDDTSFNGTYYLDTVSPLSGGVTTFTYAQAGAPDVALFHPTALTSVMTVATTGPGGDGIRITGGTYNIENVFVTGFSGNCIRVYSSGGIISDDFNIYNSKVAGCHEQGALIQGGDSQAGSTFHLMAYYNLLYGLFDTGFLGNTHYHPQLSYNHLGAWGSNNFFPTGGPTHALTSCTRASNVLTCTSTASIPAAIKVGNAIVIAGSADSTFNSRATTASCFIATVPDTTHFTCRQPGYNLANTTSAGGTYRLAGGNEWATAVGVDAGSITVGRGNSAGHFEVIRPYVEGAQAQDNADMSIRFGGAVRVEELHSGDGIDNTNSGFWLPAVQTDKSDTIFNNSGQFRTVGNSALDFGFKAGTTVGQNVIISGRKYNGTYMGTLMWSPCNAFNQFVIQDGTSWSNGLDRFRAVGSADCGGNGNTDLASRGTGAITFNMTGGIFGNGSLGTGDFIFGNAGVEVARINNAGRGIFTGGVQLGASGSIISDSRELIQNAHSCGTTTTCANTANGSNRVVFGTVTLVAGTATVTGITAFTSTSSYVCTATDSTAAAAVQVVNTSTTSITLNGTGTDVIRYQCMGN